jgi:uncharacterized protein
MPFGLLEYTIAGLIVGTSIGLTGIGGGSMMAPLLILVFHLPAAQAVQLDFLYLTPTKLVGAWRHYRRGTIDPGLTTFLAIGALPGTFIGSLYVAKVVAANPALNQALRHLIGYFILASAALLIVQLAVMWHSKVTDPGLGRIKLSLTKRIMMGVLGLGVGLFVGATSIGAGSILLPLLVLVLNVHMRQLVSTDVALGAGMAIVGAAVHSLAQTVSWEIVAALLIGSIPGALLGAQLVGVISTRLVRGCVAGALTVAGLVLVGVLSTS